MTGLIAAALGAINATVAPPGRRLNTTTLNSYHVVNLLGVLKSMKIHSGGMGREVVINEILLLHKVSVKAENLLMFFPQEKGVEPGYIY